MRNFWTLLLLFSAAVAPAQRPTAIEIAITPEHDRQTIDGFGGALVFWGANPDDTALQYAFDDLGATIVRVRGETDACRGVLQRITRRAPQAQVLVTFWQPRSAAAPAVSNWLDSVADKGYVLKPDRRAAWADEIVNRLKTIRNDWGANVTAASVQNEPNFSQPGAITCRWSPAALAEFNADFVAPRLAAAKLPVRLLGPDLAYIGGAAAEAKRFQPVNTNAAVAIFGYHMYDAYRGSNFEDFAALRARQQALGNYAREFFPGKRLWMTETTGAHWNNPEWHALGWTPTLDEHDKAIAAARYLHAALVDANASAFLWWGLTYSEPPPSTTNAEERQKFRDEGLILVGHEQQAGVNAFRELTPKYFAFKQFSRFIRAGDIRLDVSPAAAGGQLVAAFRSPDSQRVVVIFINPDKQSATVELHLTAAHTYRLAETHGTDRTHQCARTTWTGTAPAESITTFVYRRQPEPRAAD